MSGCEMCLISMTLLMALSRVLMLSYFSAAVLVACAFMSYKPSWEPWRHIQVLEFLVCFELFCLEESNFVLVCTPARTHTYAHVPHLSLSKAKRVFCHHVLSSYFTFLPVHSFSQYRLWMSAFSFGALDGLVVNQPCRVFADTFLGWFCFLVSAVNLLSFPVSQCYNCVFILQNQK